MASHDDDHNLKIFDYVIVGTGPSAAGLLLSLLEQDKSASIAVIERGGRDPAEVTLDLKRWFEAANSSHPNVRPISSSIMGRQLDLPTGQGLGGTSNINAGIVMPPLPEDLNTWPDPWKSSLPNAIKVIWKKLLEHNALQIPEQEDCFFQTVNGEGSLSRSVPWATLEQRGESSGERSRQTYYGALVTPLLAKSPNKMNMQTFFGTGVQRLLINEKRRVVGVECDTSGDSWKCIASKAVILCAGAIESPVLLMTSAIGPENDNPHFQGIGKHLKDQWILPRAYFTAWKPLGKLSANGISSLTHYKDKNNNVFQIATADAVTHDTIIPTSVAMAVRNETFIGEQLYTMYKAVLQFMIRWTPLAYLLRHYTSTILVMFLHPKSEGNVTIDYSANENSEQAPSWRRRRNVKVRVDVGYGRDPRDIELMRETWQQLSPVGEAFEIFPGRILTVLSRFLRFDWYPLFYGKCCLPYYHFAGTCAMRYAEDQQDWVVDEQLSLRDHEGIYICDASVFPSMVSCPPALTCCALGYEFGRQVISKLEENKT